MSQFINYENEQKINYIISKLPSDLINKIYTDYVKPELICRELNIILDSTESRDLNIEPLENFLRTHILPNSIVIKYLIKNDKIFPDIYKTHIINREQTLVLFPDLVSSLAGCWIMYLYH
jgi:hypothetical protein